MSRFLLRRVRKIETKGGKYSGLKRYFDAISDTAWGLPSAMPPISPEKQAEIDCAFAELSEEELTMLA